MPQLQQAALEHARRHSLATLLLAGVALLYAEGSVAEAFTLVTTVSALCFMFVWSIILISYIVYRRRRPQLQHLGARHAGAFIFLGCHDMA